MIKSIFILIFCCLSFDAAFSQEIYGKWKVASSTFDSLLALIPNPDSHRVYDKDSVYTTIENGDTITVIHSGTGPYTVIENLGPKVMAIYKGMASMTYEFKTDGTYKIEVPGFDTITTKIIIDKENQVFYEKKDGQKVAYSFVNGDLHLILENGVWQRLKKIKR